MVLVQVWYEHWRGLFFSNYSSMLSFFTAWSPSTNPVAGATPSPLLNPRNTLKRKPCHTTHPFPVLSPLPSRSPSPPSPR